MTATSETTAIESAGEALAKARERVEDAQDGAMEANSTLTGLEQAAGRGDVVDAQALVVARAEHEIKLTRFRTLDAEAKAAEEALTRLEAEAARQTLVEEFDGIDRKRAALQRKRDTAKKNYEAAEAELKDITYTVHQRLLTMGLPKVNMTADEDGELCWLIQRKGFAPYLGTLDGAGRVFRINGKVYDMHGRNHAHNGNRGVRPA